MLQRPSAIMLVKEVTAERLIDEWVDGQKDEAGGTWVVVVVWTSFKGKAKGISEMK